jgi:hypothetical protein
MGAIFLSASVPVPGRGTYYESADPFLIQCAVREFVIAVVLTRQIVWGGHPAITPMIWSICEDMGVNYADSVVLYQSKFFADQYPDENQHFRNVVFVDAVADDRAMSLRRMREAMLSRCELSAAVFIGGMEGVQAEFELFRQYHPDAPIVPVAAPGGAARELANQTRSIDRALMYSVDFARLFHSVLPVAIP